MSAAFVALEEEDEAAFIKRCLGVRSRERCSSPVLRVQAHGSGLSTAHWQGTGRGRRSRSRVSILQAQLGRTRIHMLQTRCIVPWLSTVAAPVVDVGCAHCMDLHEASRLDDDTTCRPVANSLECDRTLNRPSSTVVPCRLDWSFGRSLQHHRRLAEVQEYQVSPSFLFTSPESRILSFRPEAPSCRPGARRLSYRTLSSGRRSSFDVLQRRPDIADAYWTTAHRLP